MSSTPLLHIAAGFHLLRDEITVRLSGWLFYGGG
jgi:hypothetical protein